MTAPDITAKIAAARALEAAATPSPWVRFHDMPASDGRPHPCDCGQIWGGDDLLFWPARDVDDKHVERKEDGRLIVHARNHHAALWDVVEAAKNHLDYYVVDGANTFDALRAALAKLAEAP